MWISPSSVISVLSSVPSGVLVAAQVGGRGDKVSGDTKTVDVQTLSKAFLKVSQRLPSFINGACSWQKRKPSSLWTTAPHFWIIRRQINPYPANVENMVCS
jgi:hypothetical protein